MTRYKYRWKIKNNKMSEKLLISAFLRISCITKIKLSFRKLGTQNSKRNVPLITNQ